MRGPYVAVVVVLASTTLAECAYFLDATIAASALFLTACQQFVGELQVFKIHKEMPRNLTKMITIAEVRPNGTRAVVDDGSVLFHRKRWGRFWWTQSNLGRLHPR